MKLISSFLLLLTLSFGHAFAQQSVKAEYDSTLAAALGADAYGMKSYFLVLLKTGAVAEDNKVRRDSLFTGHLQNIARLAQQGKLVVAGPLGKNDMQLRGIFIFDVADKDDLQAMLQTDPAIEAGLLDTEIIPWYGSAALKTYLDVHQRIEKNKPGF